MPMKPVSGNENIPIWLKPALIGTTFIVFSIKLIMKYLDLD